LSLLENLHDVIKRSKLGRNRFVVSLQPFDARQFNFDSLLTGA